MAAEVGEVGAVPEGRAEDRGERHRGVGRGDGVSRGAAERAANSPLFHRGEIEGRQRGRREALRCLHVILRCAQASFDGPAHISIAMLSTSLLQCRWYVRPFVDALQIAR